MKKMFKYLIALVTATVLFFNFGNYIAYAYNSYVIFCESKVSSTLLQRVDETNDNNNYVAVSVMHNDYSKTKKTWFQKNQIAMQQLMKYRSLL